MPDTLKKWVGCIETLAECLQQVHTQEGASYGYDSYFGEREAGGLLVADLGHKSPWTCCGSVKEIGVGLPGDLMTWMPCRQSLQQVTFLIRW